MAAERRSLAAGLDHIGGVDPDTARAFIVQERPREQNPSPIRVVPEPAVQDEPEIVEAAPDVRVGEVTPTPPAAKKPTKSAPAKRPDTARLLATLLVPVTVRLRPEIAAALKRASLQRQLNGVEMYTQQDIVEEALLPWLQAEGLLD